MALTRFAELTNLRGDVSVTYDYRDENRFSLYINAIYAKEYDPLRDIYSGPLPRLDDATPRCIVYLVNSRAHGRCCYVGMTEKGLPERKRRHLQRAKAGQSGHFYNAIRKYGEDNFFWRIVEVCPDYWAALAAERKIISILNPICNMTNGGGGIKGYRHSQESKAKMSIAKKGKEPAWRNSENAEEIQKKLFKNLKGRKINLSESGKESMRRNAKLANIARRKKVIHIESGEVFESVTAASKKFSMHTSGIMYLCKHKTKSRTGNSFKYVVS